MCYDILMLINNGVLWSLVHTSIYCNNIAELFTRFMISVKDNNTLEHQ